MTTSAHAMRATGRTRKIPTCGWATTASGTSASSKRAAPTSETARFGGPFLWRGALSEATLQLGERQVLHLNLAGGHWRDDNDFDAGARIDRGDTHLAPDLGELKIDVAGTGGLVAPPGADHQAVAVSTSPCASN